jgi:hypothetical protein
VPNRRSNSFIDSAEACYRAFALAGKYGYSRQSNLSPSRPTPKGPVLGADGWCNNLVLSLEPSRACGSTILAHPPILTKLLGDGPTARRDLNLAGLAWARRYPVWAWENER